jgi:hypothetical protein
VNVVIFCQKLLRFQSYIGIWVLWQSSSCAVSERVGECVEMFIDFVSVIWYQRQMLCILL